MIVNLGTTEFATALTSLAPSLIIEDREIDEGFKRFEKAIKKTI